MSPQASYEPTHAPLRVALVAMPWSRRDRPSAAMGVLAAYVRRERPRVDLVCRSEYLVASQRIGAAFYDQISTHAYEMGELQSHRGPPLLQYRDGGSFIVIEDARFGDFRSGTFTGFQRDLYLYCMEIRTREQMARRFAGHASADDIDDALAQFVEHKVAAHENGRYLALAVASSPHLAAKRILAAAAEQERSRPEPRRLPVAVS